MACRIIKATGLVALLIFISCSSSFAATPLVVAELNVKHAIAEAECAKANAEQALADWRLQQLRKLRIRENASWQEVAEQEVVTKAAAARAQALEEFLQVVLDQQAQLNKMNLDHVTESECVRLTMPNSPRVVVWISASDASAELSKRHLENLRAKHQSTLDIDAASLQEEHETAEKAVKAYGRSGHNVHLLMRAEIRLRLAKAEYDLAVARKSEGNILSARIALVIESLNQMQAGEADPSHALARPGTCFVDATTDRDLGQSVESLVADETIANQRIQWLKHERAGVSDRIRALQVLSKYAHADPRELNDAKQQKADLELEIEQAQELLTLRQKIASDHEQATKRESFNDNPGAVGTIEVASLKDANIARHSLQLEYMKLQAAAHQATREAQQDYLVERLKRVEQIPKTARPPVELDRLRHKVEGVQHQLSIANQQLVQLDRERRRLCHQLKSQMGGQYRLVQLDNGQFIQREQIELGGALITAVGMVGHAGLFPLKTTMYPYIESTTVLDCLSKLSVRPPYASTYLLRDVEARWKHHSIHRCAFTSPWRTQSNLSRFRLAADGLTFLKYSDPGFLFCYVPYGLRPLKAYSVNSNYHHWASREYLRSASVFQYQPFYSNSPSRLDLYWHRNNCLHHDFYTQSRYRSRSNFDYRTIWSVSSPTRKHIHSP